MTKLMDELGGTQPDAGTAEPGSITPGEGLEGVAVEVPLYGYVAEFDDEHSLLQAALRTREAGFQRIDAYSPIPVEGLSQAIGFRRSFVPLIVLGGGLAGLVTGLGLQYWTMVINYPINIGGRPLNSVPMWIPVTFETTILFAAVAGVLAMFVLNGLPMPYHPLFNVAEFARASQDRFFLAIEARDALFRSDLTRKFLEGLGPVAVHEVRE